ncbi:hypothetical protein F53441_644 [Fusarium austroafricanum]|uniref:Uncharacterized protein n=1 Tax=Fusarium austroafricanum TaxID=2364996 RepID=A0A8H4PEB9_9HYPO|nr:hypothetical protein F53441_644 [Fusarium austroafricanum]
MEDAPEENVSKNKTRTKVKDCDRAEPCRKCVEQHLKCSGNDYRKTLGKYPGRDDPSGPSGIPPNGASTIALAQPREVGPPIQGLNKEVKDVGYFQTSAAQGHGQGQGQIQEMAPPLPLLNQVAAPVNVGLILSRWDEGALNYFLNIVTSLDNTIPWGAHVAPMARRDSIIMSAIAAVSTAHIESRGVNAFAQQYWAQAMVELGSADATDRVAMALLILCLPIFNTTPICGLKTLAMAMSYVRNDLEQKGIGQEIRATAQFLWQVYGTFYVHPWRFQ